ncbi:MAG: PilZ domain-containing protein [Planctomycetota bacterium]
MDKRKKIEIKKAEDSQRRDAYRRTQTQAHSLSIAVRVPSGEQYLGQFHDLSIGGASAVFAITENAVCADQMVTLTIAALSRATRVVANARVVFVTPASGGRLCGFRFTEPAKLLAQIDTFYGRFFNRRRSPRVGAPLDKRVPVELSLTGNAIRCTLLDLSLEGIQVKTTRAEAKELDGANHAFFRFKLPGQNEEFQGRGAILRRSQANESVTLGLSFDLLDEGGIAQQTKALGSWIMHRTHEVSKWDSALTKPDSAVPNQPRPQEAPRPKWNNDTTSPRNLG